MSVIYKNEGFVWEAIIIVGLLPKNSMSVHVIFLLYQMMTNPNG